MKAILISLILVLTFSSTHCKSQTENNIKTVVNEGNVSDIDVYSAVPYFQDGAGYNGKDLENLPKNRIVDFTSDNKSEDTERLNAIINELHKNGGGKINIKSGEYAFKNVILKSNIHITIESGTVIKMNHSKEGNTTLFNLGRINNQPAVENVKIIGLGTVENRPKFILEKKENRFYRVFSIGYVKNVLIVNFKIEDDLTKAAAIAFNPSKSGEESANIAENVTIANIELTGGSIGYGLVQTNVGKNLLLKNLSCQGGMTCRIEAHTGRQYDLGVDNIVVKNVASINGKAAVLLQPHSVVNGRILVDGAKSEGSTWTLFLKNGFVAKDSKRKERGTFAPSTTFKNISLNATDDSATLSFKNLKYVPKELMKFYKNPELKPILEDANYSIKKGILSKESAVKGASIAVIYIDAKYPINLPKEEDIILTGKTENRVKIIDNKN